MFGSKKYTAAIGFLLPAVAIYSIFYINPILQSFYMAFFSWNGILSVPLKYVGLKNFLRLLNSPEFARALYNVGMFILSSIVVIMPISLGLALIITSNIKGVRFFKTAFFMPVILPLTSVGLMWKLLLNPNTGLLTVLMQKAGLGDYAQNWLGDPAIAIITVVLVNAWIYVGFNMLIFAAGLTAIPQDLLESAEIDGATGFAKLWYIILPLLKESTKIFLILAVTGSLKVFDIIFVMTHGGPNGATDAPGTLLYYQAFKYNNFGFGNAIGVFILLTGLAASMLMNKYLFSESS